MDEVYEGLRNGTCSVSDPVSVPPRLEQRAPARSHWSPFLALLQPPVQAQTAGTARRPRRALPAASHRPPPCPDGACAARAAGSHGDTGCAPRAVPQGLRDTVRAEALPGAAGAGSGEGRRGPRLCLAPPPSGAGSAAEKRK